MEVWKCKKCGTYNIEFHKRCQKATCRNERTDEKGEPIMLNLYTEEYYKGFTNSDND